MVFNTTQFAMGRNLIPQKLHGWDENWSHSAVLWPLNVWDLLQMLQKTNGFPLYSIHIYVYIFIFIYIRWVALSCLKCYIYERKIQKITNWPKSKILHFSLPCIGALLGLASLAILRPLVPPHQRQVRQICRRRRQRRCPRRCWGRGWEPWSRRVFDNSVPGGFMVITLWLCQHSYWKWP